MSTDLSRQYAESVARRVHDRNAPVRWSFVMCFGDDSPPSPMVRMLRGGRGGVVRLKLYLSFLWFAAAPPHDVTYPARAWAGLIGLDDPEGNGARRISDAIVWLEREGFVTLERRPGQPSRVILATEDGSGDPYELPGATVDRLQTAEVVGDQLHRHYYLQLPSEFWTKGWMATLSAPALAMLLVLLTEQADKAKSQELWIAPSESDRRMGIAEETRSRGLRELEKVGLVTQHRRPISRDVFDFRRLRNTYTLRAGRLERAPEDRVSPRLRKGLTAVSQTRDA